MSFVPHQYTQVDSQGAADTALPSSLMSSRVPKAIATSNRVLSIPSQSGNSSASGTMNFQIAGGSNANGYLRAGSAYLRATVVASKTTAGVATDTVIFANETNSAASLINRLQISSNGTMLETINRYDNFHATIQCQATNANYVNNDCTITEYTGQQVVIGTATSTTYYVAIPLFSAVLSNVKSFPLFLAGLNIQIDFNSATSAFKCFGAGLVTPITGYTISQAEIVFENILPDFSLMDTIRKEMAETGKLFEMPMTTALGLTTSSGAQASFSYNVGLNLASVAGILIGEILSSVETASTAATLAGVQNSFIRNSTEAPTNSRRFYIDGKQLVNYDVWSDSQNFNETQRALSVLLDPANTTIATRATYCAAGETAGRYYIVGQNSKRFNEQNLCMTSTPCQNLVIQLAKSGTPQNTSMYIYVLYDQVAVIDANGSVAVAK